MFCRKCGKEIFDNSEYCEDCRNASLFVPPPLDNTPARSTPTPKQKKKCCPKCKSRNMQIVTNTEFSSQTKGGGYSAGKGCCGYILLGPLGLLCGACGSKSKTTVTSKSTTVWTCLDCGNKFRDIADIEKDIVNQTRKSKIGPLSIYILGIIFFATMLWLYNLHEDTSSLLIGIVFAIFCIAMGILSKHLSNNRLYALNEEKKEIERNGYIDE